MLDLDLLDLALFDRDLVGCERFACDRLDLDLLACDLFEREPPERDLFAFEPPERDRLALDRLDRLLLLFAFGFDWRRLDLDDFCPERRRSSPAALLSPERSPASTLGVVMIDVVEALVTGAAA